MGIFEHKTIDFLTKKCQILTKQCSFSNKKVMIFLDIFLKYFIKYAFLTSTVVPHDPHNPTPTREPTLLPHHNGYVGSEATRVRTQDHIVGGHGSCQGTNRSICLTRRGLGIYLTSFWGFFPILLKSQQTLGAIQT